MENINMKGFVFRMVFIVSLTNSQSVRPFWTGNIVFEDNFNGANLNQSKWDYQEGCSAVYGPNNLQCYTRKNVAVQNGTLVITAKREKMEDKQYTSGRIIQKGTGYRYGAYVIRARLPRGDHLWPALWLLHEKQCRYEEIDIAEARGQPAEARIVEMTGHWGRRYDALTSASKRVTLPFELNANFHEYAVLWTPSKLEWYVDNIKYFQTSLTDGTYTNDTSKLPCTGKPEPFSESANFILNVGVGGSFFEGMPPPNLNTWTKPTMEIDWVRIYQE